MLELKIHLYQLQELNENAKRRAIEDQRAFMLEVLRPDYIDGVTDWTDPEKMEMYRDEYEYILDNDDPVIESIEINEYIYFADGEMCHSVTYCGTHPRAGQTDITVHGEKITLSGVNTL